MQIKTGEYKYIYDALRRLENRDPDISPMQHMAEMLKWMLDMRMGYTDSEESCKKYNDEANFNFDTIRTQTNHYEHCLAWITFFILSNFGGPNMYFYRDSTAVGKWRFYNKVPLIHIIRELNNACTPKWVVPVQAINKKVSKFDISNPNPAVNIQREFLNDLYRVANTSDISHMSLVIDKTPNEIKPIIRMGMERSSLIKTMTETEILFYGVMNFVQVVVDPITKNVTFDTTNLNMFDIWKYIWFREYKAQIGRCIFITNKNDPNNIESWDPIEQKDGAGALTQLFMKWINMEAE